MLEPELVSQQKPALLASSLRQRRRRQRRLKSRVQRLLGMKQGWQHAELPLHSWLRLWSALPLFPLQLGKMRQRLQAQQLVLQRAARSTREPSLRFH